MVEVLALPEKKITCLQVCVVCQGVPESLAAAKEHQALAPLFVWLMWTAWELNSG